MNTSPTTASIAQAAAQEPESYWAAHPVRAARAALSRLIEPGEHIAGICNELWGPTGFLDIVLSGADPSTSQLAAFADTAGDYNIKISSEKLRTGLSRWRARAQRLDLEKDIHAAHRLGGGLLIPEDQAWPEQLNDLGPRTPFALWFRLREGEHAQRPAYSESHYPESHYPESRASTAHHPEDGIAIEAQRPTASWRSQLPAAYGLLRQRMPEYARSLAIVGSRETTDYGVSIASNWAAELTGTGMSIISGGAYGIDAAAHRGALDSPATGPSAPTIAVLAGGIDKLYPAGHQRLLQHIMKSGFILSEVPVGSAPTRYRFLHRNRLIAALTAGCVVVQARWRSGALSTAHHGLTIGRAIGAVPGSIFEPSSAGCHRLLRETPAVAVTDTPEILALLIGDTATGAIATHHPSRHSPNSTGQVSDPRQESGPGHPGSTDQTSNSHQTSGQEQLPVTIIDNLDDAETRIFEALPRRGSTTVDKLCDIAGLPLPQVLSGLTRLQRKDLVEASNGEWKRRRPPPSSGTAAHPPQQSQP